MSPSATSSVTPFEPSMSPTVHFSLDQEMMTLSSPAKTTTSGRLNVSSAGAETLTHVSQPVSSHCMTQEKVCINQSTDIHN